VDNEIIARPDFQVIGIYLAIFVPFYRQTVSHHFIVHSGKGSECFYGMAGWRYGYPV